MSKPTKRVGIYSGAFDPIHQGHIEFALAAAHTSGLAKVFFLVEPNPRHKQGVKALEHRLEMVRLATRHQPQLGLIVLEDTRFTIVETWPQLQARFVDAELVMLLGDDVFRRLSHWPYLQDLALDTHFVVGLRQGTLPGAIDDYMGTLQKTRHVRVRYECFIAPHQTVSSRQIRHQLRQGKPVQALDKAVQRYITSHQLYSASKE